MNENGAPSRSEHGPCGLPLSVFVITYNEADRLGPVLEAARPLTDDLVVIDSGSIDDTREVARSHGARVIINTPWPGYGPQKRFGEDQCEHDWVLNIDADEWIPPDLAEEIRALFAAGEPQCPAYRLSIAEVFPGEEAPRSWAYVRDPVRLYRKSVGRYSASPVHDRVALPDGAAVGKLTGTVHHRSFRSLGDELIKLNAYSDRQVADLEARGVRLSGWRIYVEFPVSFLKAYFGRLHCLRGAFGFMTAMNFAYLRHLRVAKHMERRRLGKRPSPHGASARLDRANALREVK